MDDLKSYNIKGKVVFNNQPIGGAKISTDNNEVFSSPTGDFVISGNYSELFNLNIFKENYANYSTLPFDSNDNIKNNIGVIELSPLQLDLNENIKKLQSLPESQINAIILSKTNFETLQQQKLNSIINTLKFTVLPIILKMLSQFAISNAKKALDKNYSGELICPTQEEIDRIIKRKNKLVRQLNITYKVIKTTSTIINTTLVFITSLEVTYKLLLLLPTSNPGVSAIVDQIDKRIKKYKNIVQITAIILNVVKITLKEILDYLNLLDKNIQRCYPEAEQEQISSELTEFTKQEPSPVIDEVNGFTFEVETEKTTKSLKRRRALAKNKKGVVMLKGEWSFSSVDQILIDELIFYIEQNDLKAD